MVASCLVFEPKYHTDQEEPTLPSTNYVDDEWQNLSENDKALPCQENSFSWKNGGYFKSYLPEHKKMLLIFIKKNKN